MSSPATRPDTAPTRTVRPDPPRRPEARAGVAVGLITAVVSAWGVWLTWRVFVGSAAGQRVDEAVFEGAMYGRNRLWQVAQPVLDVVSVPYIALVFVVAVLIAAIRRRWGLALQVALLLGGANLTTQVLKNIVFERPDLGFGATNALPSGHTTAAASVSAALLLVVPPRARPLVAVLGASYTAATGVSTLVGRWHRPSDVVAAVLVVMAWSGLACALAAASRPRPPAGVRATATAELARPVVPATAHGRVRGGRAVRLGGGFLALVGLLAALPAAYSLRRSWTTAGDLDTRAELLVAYAGGAFGVVFLSAVAFAVLLVVRQAAGKAA